jgi:DeoR/GlpR family transcriptional regulator of sugar metabolism
MNWLRVITVGSLVAGTLLAQQSFDLIVYGGTAMG